MRNFREKQSSDFISSQSFNGLRRNRKQCKWCNWYIITRVAISSLPSSTATADRISAYPARTWTSWQYNFFIHYLFISIFPSPCCSGNNETCPERTIPALPSVIGAAFILMCQSPTVLDLQLHLVQEKPRKSTFPWQPSVSLCCTGSFIGSKGAALHCSYTAKCVLRSSEPLCDGGSDQ